MLKLLLHPPQGVARHCRAGVAQCPNHLRCCSKRIDPPGRAPPMLRSTAPGVSVTSRPRCSRLCSPRQLEQTENALRDELLTTPGLRSIAAVAKKLPREARPNTLSSATPLLSVLLRHLPDHGLAHGVGRLDLAAAQDLHHGMAAKRYFSGEYLAELTSRMRSEDIPQILDRPPEEIRAPSRRAPV